MSDDFRAFEARRIRLLILQAIALQASGSWTLTMLQKHLQASGYDKTRDYVSNQLYWLEREALAVKIIAAGTELVVTIRTAGRGHVERRDYLAGVDKPDDES